MTVRGEVLRNWADALSTSTGSVPPAATWYPRRSGSSSPFSPLSTLLTTASSTGPPSSSSRRQLRSNRNSDEVGNCQSSYEPTLDLAEHEPRLLNFVADALSKPAEATAIHKICTQLRDASQWHVTTSLSRLAKGLVFSGHGGSQQIAALKAQVSLSDTSTCRSNLTFGKCIPLFSVAFRALVAGYVAARLGGLSGQGS